MITELSLDHDESADINEDSESDSDEQVTILSFPVKHGVRFWNVLAIPLVPVTIMLLATYVNAQTIFLLKDPEMFDVPADRIGVIAS